MHTQESSIENHETRRATTEEILSRLCPDKHDEHDWNRACHDFVKVNFAEIEARVVANHLDSNGANGRTTVERTTVGRTTAGRTTVEETADFDALANGNQGTMVL